MKLEEWQRQNQFVPLTYLECTIEKPLIVKLDDKWNFVTYLQKAVNFAIIIDTKDTATAIFEYWKSKRPKSVEGKAEKTQGVMGANYQLIAVLYEISKQEYIENEALYKEFFYTFMGDNLNVLYDVWEKVLDYNSRIGKKIESLMNYNVIQEYGQWTNGAASLPEEEKFKPHLF